MFRILSMVLKLDTWKMWVDLGFEVIFFSFFFSVFSTFTVKMRMFVRWAVVVVFRIRFWLRLLVRRMVICLKARFSGRSSVCGEKL